MIIGAEVANGGQPCAGCPAIQQDCHSRSKAANLVFKRRPRRDERPGDNEKRVRLCHQCASRLARALKEAIGED